MSKPVIIAVDDDPQVLAAVRRDLRSHYAADYRIMSAISGAEAVATVRTLKSRGDALAMILSDQRMPEMLGVDVLMACREIYPDARRVLLTAYSDIDAAIKAINEAHLDYYLSKPWDPPEERLFPVVDDLLDAWQADYLPEPAALRLVGHQWSSRSHEIKDFLASNMIPYRWLESGRDADAGILLEAAGVSADELPALFLEDGSVLRQPTIAEVAESLGRLVTAAYELYDLVIVGAGPAGLAAAVYGASEGLRTLLIDRRAPGGQAGSSSRIENYLGFPAGVSGSELTRRALAQVQRLGAEFLAPVEVTSIEIEGGYKRLVLGDGRTLVARALLAATGMVYREHTAEGISAFTGAGVYYGAANTEAQACIGRRVAIVGGGNSAGQSAMYLARFAHEVIIIVRRDGLTESMSQYLIDQIAATPNIVLWTRTEIERVEGDGQLERIVVRCLDGAESRTEEVAALFVFIGTRPHGTWLPEEVMRSDKGFIYAGRDAAIRDEFTRSWKIEREPLPLETSVPGIFVAGDLRAGAMNRVASAVGEGAMAVKLVHEYLAMT
jgi:thioredoxin reductase (NADPH)